MYFFFFFFSSRRRHTRSLCDWSSDVCSSDLVADRTIVRQARRHLSRHGAGAFLAMLIPAVGFPLGLFLVRHDPRFAWVRDVAAYPWEFWAIACCGIVATLGGAADWLFHRSGET